MSRILAVGAGPLLQQGVRILGAHCLRTWNLVKPLTDAGHEVALFTLPIFHDRPEELAQAGVAQHEYQNFSYHSFLNADDAFNLPHLQRVAESFRPDALLGINAGPAALLAQVNWPAPLWVDLFGHLMVEAQGKAAMMRSNLFLKDAWRVEELLMRRADHFSTCSRRQIYAVHGQLGAVGRLNHQTFRYHFCSFMPPAYDPFHVEPPQGSSPEIPGGMVPEDAFIVLWSGGYNTWTNVDALACALDHAMAQCPNLHFISTGGQLYGHDEITYPRFESLIARSRWADRCHLLGWVDAAQLPHLYAQANLALCFDSDNLETMFGTRTRIVNLLAAGLPVLTTRGSEIVEDLERAQCIRVCAPDDPRAMGEAIMEACAQSEQLKREAVHARDYVRRHYSFAENTKPLQQWALAPYFAPDNSEKLTRVAILRSAGYPAPQNPFDLPLSLLEANANAEVRSAKRNLLESARRWWRRFLPQHKPVEKPMRIIDLALGDAVGGASAAGETLVFVNPQDFAAALEKITAIALNAPQLTIHLQTNGHHPSQFEWLANALVDALPVNAVEAAVVVHGPESQHIAHMNDPEAWNNVVHNLVMLGFTASAYPARFRLIARVIAHRENNTELQSLCAMLKQRFGCEVELETPEK